jgi:hypothetical protein
VTRHRLHRGGDRQLNRALHTIVLARLHRLVGGGGVGLGGVRLLGDRCDA